MQENIMDLSLKNLNFDEIKDVFDEATKTKKIELIKFVLKKVEDFMLNVNVESFSNQTIEDITEMNSNVIKVFLDLDVELNYISREFELNLKALKISEVTSIPREQTSALLQLEKRECFEKLLSMFFKIKMILDGKIIQKANKENKMKTAKILSKFHKEHSNEVSLNDLALILGTSETSIRNYIGEAFSKKCKSDKHCLYRKFLE